MVGNLILGRQLRSRRDQWRRKLAIFTKKSCLWYLLQRRALKKQSCKLMTKPRRYGGKSHPATPTQEQTRPISTETSNLVEKSTLFVIFPAKTGLEKTKVASWWPNRADMVENLILESQFRSKRTSVLYPLQYMADREMVDIFSDLKSLVYSVFSYLLKLEFSRSRTDEVCMLRKRALSRLISAFWYLLRKRALSKQNVANWWPNRADMVENLIPRPQLRSRRDQ